MPRIFDYIGLQLMPDLQHVMRELIVRIFVWGISTCVDGSSWINTLRLGRVERAIRVTLSGDAELPQD